MLRFRIWTEVSKQHYSQLSFFRLNPCIILSTLPAACFAFRLGTHCTFSVIFFSSFFFVSGPWTTGPTLQNSIMQLDAAPFVLMAYAVQRWQVGFHFKMLLNSRFPFKILTVHPPVVKRFHKILYCQFLHLCFQMGADFLYFSCIAKESLLCHLGTPTLSVHLASRLVPCA